MERVIMILSALMLNALLGGPRRLYAPLGLSRVTQLPATFIRSAERKLNREHRSLKQRQLRGALLTVAVALASLFAGWLIHKMIKYNFRFIEIALLASLLPVRPTWDCVAQIYKSLKAGDVAAARKALEGTIWRHYALLDEHGVARAGIEMLAVNFCEKIFSPCVLYIILGLPGFFLSKSLYMMVETLSPTDSSEPGFAHAAKVLHYGLHYVQSRIAVVLWLAAMIFLPGSNPLKAAAEVVSGDIDLGSPRMVSVLAVACVLKLSLGGPTSVYIGDQWIGKGNPKAMPDDVRRALFLFILVHLFLIILFGLL